MLKTISLRAYTSHSLIWGFLWSRLYPPWFLRQDALRQGIHGLSYLLSPIQRLLARSWVGRIVWRVWKDWKMITLWANNFGRWNEKETVDMQTAKLKQDQRLDGSPHSHWILKGNLTHALGGSECLENVMKNNYYIAEEKEEENMNGA
jgi:hypothetical protein